MVKKQLSELVKNKKLVKQRAVGNNKTIAKKKKLPISFGGAKNKNKKKNL